MNLQDGDDLRRLMPPPTRWLVTVSGSDEPDTVNEVHDASELARVVAVAAMLGKANRVIVTTPDTPTCDHEAALAQWEARWAALKRTTGGQYATPEINRIEREMPV